MTKPATRAVTTATDSQFESVSGHGLAFVFHQAEESMPFLFTPFDSFLYAVDILGYCFMSVATLFAARVFTGNGVERVVRVFMTANGMLLPFIALQMYVHGLIWIAALWAVTFPGSTWSLAILFRRMGRTATRCRPL